jgi:hypothetical protein
VVSKEIREMTIEEEPEVDVPEPTSGGNSDNDSQSGILCGSIHFMGVNVWFFFTDNETVDESKVKNSKPKKVEFPDTQVKVPLLGEK